MMTYPINDDDLPQQKTMIFVHFASVEITRGVPVYPDVVTVFPSICPEHIGGTPDLELGLLALCLSTLQ